MTLRYLAAALLAIATTGACSSITAPDPIDVTVEMVQLRSEEEHLAWPFTPTISGGTAIRVRGIALAGCGKLAASATRRGGTVGVTVSAVEVQNPCVSSAWAWQPFTATLALPPGDYRVSATTAGHEGVAHFVATVLAP